MPQLDAAVLNKMLSGRISDVAKAYRDPDPEVELSLRRAAGLHPLPPRTALNTQELEVIEGDGFRLTKLIYASRIGFSCPALLFEPLDSWKSAVVCASDAWKDGKQNPCFQSFGISMALQGIAVLAIEPPGQWFENLPGDRVHEGGAWDPILRTGAPALGTYAWDVIRGLDLLLGKNPDASVAALGVGVGAEAAMLGFLFDARFACLVSANALGSHEVLPRIPESLCQLAGIAELGDVADWFAARTQAPVLFLSCEKDLLHSPSAVHATANKIQKQYNQRGSDAMVKVHQFLGDPDFNRRMREVTAGFLLHHLQGAPMADYAPEPRPLTDGNSRPYVAGTYPPEMLSCFGGAQSDNSYPQLYGGEETGMLTLEQLAMKNLTEPYPEVTPKMIPWGKYGKLEPLGELETIRLTDSSPDSQSLTIPFRELDLDKLCAIGLSAPEFVAQVLHLLLPGHPADMETTAQGSGGIQAVLKSVRTLVSKEEPPAPPKKVEGIGAFSAEVVVQLKKLRPDLEIGEVSGVPQAEDSVMLVPGQRYRAS